MTNKHEDGANPPDDVDSEWTSVKKIQQDTVMETIGTSKT